jgi:hypothetical protein
MNLLQQHPKGNSTSVGFQILTAVLLKIKVLRNVMLCFWVSGFVDDSAFIFRVQQFQQT